MENLTILRCHHDRVPSQYDEDDDLVDKFDTYRGNILANLIFGLPKQGATSTKLETLDIVNLPCRPQPDLTGDPSFSALLGTLQTLSLRFDYSKANDRRHAGSRRGDEYHKYFTDLPKTWLAPAATNLTCLALRASELWGYILKVDFSHVHFPQLQSLVMQKFVFSQDWQLEWILSHTSLQELCLFQCRILIHATWTGEQDEEGYPTSMLAYDPLSLQDYHYDKSWYEYYERLLSCLGSLRRFTTKPDDAGVKTELIGLYGVWGVFEWSTIIPEGHKRAEDEEMREQLMAKTEDRMLAHLKATTKRRPGQ